MSTFGSISEDRPSDPSLEQHGPPAERKSIPTSFRPKPHAHRSVLVPGIVVALFICGVVALQFLPWQGNRELHTIKENGEYLLDLINDILDLSKIESGKCEIEQLACSPHQIVGEVSSLMGVRTKAKGLPLDVRFDGPIPDTIHTDPTRLRQILINVVGNAIKFTETGSVQIITRLLDETGEPPKLEFAVTDTGIGITEDSIQKLFSPFTQADGSTTRRFGGTGPGLSISKRLVELLGGELSVSSTVGTGSTFFITVATGPLDDVRLIENAVEAGAKPTSEIMADDTDDPLLNHRILLAEDGPDNQRLIGFILKKAGAEVTLADK